MTKSYSNGSQLYVNHAANRGGENRRNSPKSTAKDIYMSNNYVSQSSTIKRPRQKYGAGQTENSLVYDRLDTGQVTTERNMLPDGLNFAQIQVITRNSEVSMVSPKGDVTEHQQLVSFKNSQSALILQSF